MSDRLRTVIVAGDAETRSRLRRLVGADASAPAIGEFGGVTEAVLNPRAQQPDVVLLAVASEGGPGNGGLPADIERVAAAFPHAAIIVTGPPVSGDLLLRISRAGAFEYLAAPAQPGDFKAALGKVQRLRRGAAAPPPRTGRVTAVYSPKGGLGVTTLATNLGVALAQGGNEEVVLVDLDIAQSHVATFLNVRGTYSVLDAFENIDRLDDLYLRGLLVRHDSGLWVLPGPAQPARSPVAAEHVRLGLEILGAHFDHTVLDLRHDLDEGAKAALRAADDILLVTALEVPAISSTVAALNAFREFRLDLERVHLVLVRHGAREDIPLADAEEAFGRKISAQIPSDYPTVMSSINAGRPAVLAAPRSKVAQGIAGLGWMLGPRSANGSLPKPSAGSLFARLRTSQRPGRATS